MSDLADVVLALIVGVPLGALAWAHRRALSQVEAVNQDLRDELVSLADLRAETAERHAADRMADRDHYAAAAAAERARHAEELRGAYSAAVEAASNMQVAPMVLPVEPDATKLYRTEDDEINVDRPDTLSQLEALQGRAEELGLG